MKRVILLVSMFFGTVSLFYFGQSADREFFKHRSSQRAVSRTGTEPVNEAANDSAADDSPEAD